MFNPRGSIVRTMRVTEEYVAADGSEVKLTASNAGIIVTVHGRSDARKAFKGQCNKNGFIVVELDDYAQRDWTFCRRTGQKIVGESVANCTRFQVIGEADKLEALTEHWCVSEWAFAVSVRIPTSSAGNGEAKPRGSSGSAFGKPMQLKATGIALAKTTADAVKMLLKEDE